MPAFPVEMTSDENGMFTGAQTGNARGFAIGLSKREYLAALIDVSKDIDGHSVDFIKALVGRDIPKTHLENLKFWAEAEAKLRVIKADALLLELSKPQP